MKAVDRLVRIVITYGEIVQSQSIIDGHKNKNEDLRRLTA